MHSLVYLFYLVHLVNLEYIVHLDHYVRFLFCNGHEEASGGNWVDGGKGHDFLVKQRGVHHIVVFNLIPER